MSDSGNHRMNSNSPGPADILRDHPHLLVRRILCRDDELTDALLTLAAGDTKKWSVQEWDALLAELAGSEETLEDWLILNS